MVSETMKNRLPFRKPKSAKYTIDMKKNAEYRGK